MRTNKFIVTGFLAGWLFLVGSVVYAKNNRNMDVKSYQYLSKAMNRYINGTCTTTLKPDHAVIAGGITSENADPEKALQELRKKIAHLTSIVKNHNANLKLYERIRAVKPLLPVFKHYRGNQLDSSKMLFVFIQRLEIISKPDANIDRLTITLVKEGMNHFGKSMKRNSRYRGKPQVLVYYRFKDPVKALEGVKDRCIKNAVENWCVAQFSAAEKMACSKAIYSVSNQFKSTNMRFTVGPFLHENGNMKSVYINYPWKHDQFKRLELIGNVSVQVNGYVNLRLPRRYR